jgi:hypothetical protein
VRGRIYVCEGDIIHAESGALQGEMALYGLLGLRGGEFNLSQFSEPSQRTISGQYEFLLMEAARLQDEGANPLESGVQASAGESAPPAEPIAPATAAETSESEGRVQIKETLLATGSAEVLYHWECQSIERRLKLLGQIEHHAAVLSNLLPTGRFDRLEIRTAEDRMVCQVQTEMRLIVRSSTAPS